MLLLFSILIAVLWNAFSTNEKLAASPSQETPSSEELSTDLPTMRDGAKPEPQELDTRLASNQRYKEQRLKDDLQQIELARVAAQSAREEQLAKQALLDSLIDNEEARSLTKIELKSIVEQWRGAWEAGEIERYLSYYSDQFEPRADLSLEQWKKLRRLRVKPDREIELDLRNFDIQLDSDNAIIEFDQRYKAGGFTDTGRKRLTLSNDGFAWKIILEEEI